MIRFVSTVGHVADLVKYCVNKVLGFKTYD